MIKKTFLAVTGLTLVTLAIVTTAAGPSDHGSAASQVASRAYLHSFNLPAHGVAIQGYSPVSYFEGRAERGDALFAVEHNGVSYHLTNAAQVATFRANPERFEPAFGGWCAFGMAVEDKFPIDPTRFKIVDGKLLLFLTNAGVDALDIWNGKEQSGLMEKAASHWAKVQG